MKYMTIGKQRSRCMSSLFMGIESSCDDTGVAIVSSEGRILSNVVRSQADIHAAWGGVVPKLAQEAHMNAIDGCVEQALAEAGVGLEDVSGVGVTIGPGLSLCLRVGVSKAQEICNQYGVEMIPVHHMEAHAMVARLPSDASSGNPVEFPFLCLLVSGGHNLLLIVEGLGRYVQLGTTLDDALGEAYDKIARILEIDLIPSGGASIERLAKEGDPTAYTFPVPLKKRQTCDFSFAGLKTSVRLAVEKEKEEYNGSLPESVKANIAASFQSVAVKHLEQRVRRAFEWARESHPDIRHLVVAGGVASNQYLRGRLESACRDNNAALVCPPPGLCTDNGVMVAWAAIERKKANLPIQQDQVLPDGSPKPDDWLDLKPRWPLTERRDPRAFEAPRSAKKKNLHTSLELLTASKAS